LNADEQDEEGASETPVRKVQQVKTTKTAAIMTLLALLAGAPSTNAIAADAGNPPISAPNAAPKSSEKDEGQQRNFYEVLEDLLGDYEFDIKNGEVNGLKDLSIRNMAVSENIPPSFKSHLELLVTERILRNTKTRVIQCLPCRARRTVLNGDQVVITSADTNSAELARIAKLQGIAHFLDVAFSYQPSGMVMSMYITDPESGSIVWSRSYNSETSRASAFRRGVDYSQIDNARRQTEYAAQLQYRLGLIYQFEPNIANSPSGCLGLSFRLMERYDNRKKEVGFEANYLVDAPTIVSTTAGTTGNLYNGFTLNLTLLFMHTWNFIGEEENYNKMRGGLNVGVGGTYASGFLGALFRVGWEWRLGKHFSVTPMLGYRPASSAYVSGAAAGPVSGLEYGMGIHYLF